ncbi:MAG: T9SS type A sorting domain-containing protein [Ferruginibacter sp.]
MKKKFTIIIALFCLLSTTFVQAQVTTNSGSGLAATYPSLSAAVTALNAATITSPVTITLAGNETAPAGGYAITASGTAVNTIIIQGNASTITASAAQVVGNLNDAIFKIIGGDYITIKSFGMQENAANTVTVAATNNMTEWGVALLYTSATDGAQNNSILNNTISLNRTYQNSFGIYSNVRHTALDPITIADITAASGSNSGNKVYSNSISNVNFAIVFIGCGSTTSGLMDNGNDIGGSSAATGNTITNSGGIGVAPSAYVALTGNNYLIFDNNQYNDNISYNNISSASGTTTTITMGGILKNYSTGTTAQPTGTITTNINNNTVTIINSTTTGGIVAINNQGLSPALSTATVNMNNNSVLNCAIIGALATSAGLTAIQNLSAPGILNMNSNIITGNTSTSATTGGFTGILNQGAVVTTNSISNNQLGNASASVVVFSGVSSGLISLINTSGVSATCALTINGNNFQATPHTVATTGNFQCIVSSGAVLSETINNNNFNNITVNTSAQGLGFLIAATNSTPTVNVTGNFITTQYSNINTIGSSNYIAIIANSGAAASGTSTISNNTLSNISFKTTTSLGAVIYWINGNVASSTHNITVTGNNISNIVNNGTATTSSLYVLAVGLGNVNTISNNNISNITGNAQTIGLLTNSASLNATGVFNVFSNTVSNVSSSATVSQAQGMQCAAGPGQNIYKNKIYDINMTGTGTVIGIIQSNTTVGATCNLYNNIVGRIYATSTSAANSGFGVSGLLLSSTVANTTNVYYNTVNLDGNAAGNSYNVLMNSTVPTFNLRNNIFINNAVPTGGFAQMVYYRGGAVGATYAVTSNNNILYAGTPGPLNLIYAEGSTPGTFTTQIQTLAAFQTYVGPTREAQSKTENTAFWNTTTGSSPVFLHVNASVPSVADNGAVNIAGFTDDFDGVIRQGNPGYAGSGSAPDIGATEFDFGTIPVNLMTFTAQRTGNVNLINWSTAQEINSKYFVIERSNDGNNFSSIVQVNATGNSATATSYSYVDNHPVIGTNYYRLRMVDKDNSSKYSWIRTVRNEGIADVAVYPNPVKDVLNVSISADKAGKGSMMITDINGKLIYSNSISVAQGNNNLPVNLNKVAAGAYIIKVQLNDDVVVKKFNKL